jgi:hypothetical protein
MSKSPNAPAFASNGNTPVFEGKFLGNSFDNSSLSQDSNSKYMGSKQSEQRRISSGKYLDSMT